MASPNIRFAREPLTDHLWSEAMPLLLAHWREISHFQDIPLDPDRDLYRACEEGGILRVYTVRADHRGIGVNTDLVGYAIFFVRPNPHYKGSLQAAQDVIYLAPTVRGGTGYRFIAWCDEQLASEGVQVVRQHLKAAHDFGPLLERQGYELEDKIYVKRLDVPVRASAHDVLVEATA